MKKALAIIFCTLSIALSGAFTGCAKLKSSEQDNQSVQGLRLNPFENPKYYFGTATTLTVQAAYEPGAEPYITSARGRSLWNLLELNVRALFEGRSFVPRIEIPKQLSAMQAIGAQNKALWTNNDIYALSQRLRQSQTTSDHAYFWVVFLKGNFSKDGEKPVTNTLAVNITESGVIAIFKDVIHDTVDSEPDDEFEELNAEYLEQSTLIHEMGHALGLVELGIPSTTSHHDGEHKGHCTNPNCVMYYLNNGASNLREWIARIVLTGDTIVFDDACLNDARQYQPPK